MEDNKDWRAAVNQELGAGDSVALIQHGLSVGGPVSHTFVGTLKSYNFRWLTDFRRMLMANGLDPFIAGKIEEAFMGSGQGAYAAALVLGLGEQFIAGGIYGLRPKLN
jgi:hypothetical protein